MIYSHFIVKNIVLYGVFICGYRHSTQGIIPVAYKHTLEFYLHWASMTTNKSITRPSNVLKWIPPLSLKLSQITFVDNYWRSNMVSTRFQSTSSSLTSSVNLLTHSHGPRPPTTYLPILAVHGPQQSITHSRSPRPPTNILQIWIL